MNALEFERVALSFFPKKILDYLNDGTQYGFNNYLDKTIKKIGYSINLTEDIILQAKTLNVDLLITHHNVWEDHFELRDDCLRLLEEHQIIHFFNHLPLDSVPFGTSHSLMNDLGLQKVADFCFMDDLSFGVIGAYDPPITLKELQDKLTSLLNHKILVWKNNDKMISKVALVSGSGSDLESLHEAHGHNCDAYITGEKKLKTLLYAKHIKMNFLLGSHTFTEIHGLRSYINLMNQQMKQCEFVELQDEYIEVGDING